MFWRCIYSHLKLGDVKNVCIYIFIIFSLKRNTKVSVAAELHDPGLAASVCRASCAWMLHLHRPEGSHIFPALTVSGLLCLFQLLQSLTMHSPFAEPSACQSWDGDQLLHVHGAGWCSCSPPFPHVSRFSLTPCSCHPPTESLWICCSGASQ